MKVVIKTNYQYNEVILPKDIYSLYLEIINGIAFTNREIDTVACIISGRSAKKIASFLSISPKTVENYVRNIMLKVGCRSQECIRDFIEKSGKFTLIKKYYSSLLIFSAFERELKKILLLSNKKNISCLILCNEKKRNNMPFISHLENYLKLAGIKVFREILAENKIGNQDVNYIIYPIHSTFLEQSLTDNDLRELENSILVQMTKENSYPIIFILNGGSSTQIPKELLDFNCVNLSEKENFYFLVFEILKILLPTNISLDKNVLEFKKHYEALSEPLILKNDSKENKLSSKDDKDRNNILKLNLSKIGMFLLISTIFIICGTWFLIFKLSKNGVTKFSEFKSQDFQANVLKNLNWNLPKQEYPFVGRESLLKALDNKLKLKDTELNIQVISGLGGVGKTQLALQYILHTEHPFSLRAWFRAGNLTELQAQYEEFAKNQGYLSKNREGAIQFVKNWLAQNPGWLLVFDNVINFNVIKDLLPDKGGNILITTRCQELPLMIKVFHIGVMEPADAFELVKQTIGKEEPEINILTKKLGYLPLALVQAGAYIRYNKVSVIEYLNLYHHYQQYMLADRTFSMGIDQQDPVATTWNVSLEAIETEARKKGIPPIARILLTVCAYLNSEEIPKKILLNWLIKAYPEFKTPELLLNQVLGQLQNHSLITLNSYSISLHTLVQATLIYEHRQISFQSYNAYYPPLTREWYEKLLAVFREELEHKTLILEDETRNMQLLSHLQSLMEHYEELWIKQEQGLSVEALNDKGYVLSNYLYDPRIIKSYFEQVLNIKEQYYSKNHVEVGKTLVSLGCVYRDLEENKKAKKLIEKSLKIFELHYGKENIWTTIASANLGYVYLALGKSRKAQKYLESALINFEKYYGKDSVWITESLHSLGHIYLNLEKLEEAKKVLERALVINERYYGKNYINTGKNLTFLGKVYRDLGNIRLAKAMLEHALSIHENYFGKDHLWVSITLRNLSDVYFDLGYTAKAKNLLERALAIDKHYYTKNVVLNKIPVYEQLDP